MEIKKQFWVKPALWVWQHLAWLFFEPSPSHPFSLKGCVTTENGELVLAVHLQGKHQYNFYTPTEIFKNKKFLAAFPPAQTTLIQTLVESKKQSVREPAYRIRSIHQNIHQDVDIVLKALDQEAELKRSLSDLLSEPELLKQLDYRDLILLGELFANEQQSRLRRSIQKFKTDHLEVPRCWS